MNVQKSPAPSCLSDTSFVEDDAISPHEPDDDLTRRVLGGQSPKPCWKGTSRVRRVLRTACQAVQPPPCARGSVTFSDRVETCEIPLDLWAVAEREQEEAEAAAWRARRRQELAKRQVSLLPSWCYQGAKNPVGFLMTASLADLLRMARQYNIGSLRLFLGMVLVYECAVPMRRQALQEKWAILGLVLSMAKQVFAESFAHVCLSLAAAAAGR